MNKKLPKAKIHRSKLCNNFLRQRPNENRKTYPKQRNYYVSLLRKIKKNYYSNLTEKSITDNKKFWKSSQYKNYKRQYRFRLKY